MIGCTACTDRSTANIYHTKDMERKREEGKKRKEN